MPNYNIIQTRTCVRAVHRRRRCERVYSRVKCEFRRRRVKIALNSPAAATETSRAEMRKTDAVWWPGGEVVWTGEIGGCARARLSDRGRSG